MILVKFQCAYGTRAFFATTLTDVVDSQDGIHMLWDISVQAEQPSFIGFANEVTQMLQDGRTYGNNVDANWLTVWTWRERYRLANGTYMPFPTPLNHLLIDGHYAHLPVKSESTDSIAFTESPEKGRRDKQTVMKFGRYLKRYHPNMPDSEIQDHVNTLRSATLPKVYSLHFTTDKAKIREIFETPMSPEGNASYTSCMHGGNDTPKFADWSPKPYDVYSGSPDVSLAYLADNHARLLARTIVTKNKYFIRTYASAIDGNIECSNYNTELRNLLKSEGYTRGDLSGCRLTKHSDVAPYLDGDAVHVYGSGKYWIVTDSASDAEYTWHNTDGTMDECEPEYEYTCDNCGNGCNEANYSEALEQSYCDHCTSRHWTMAITHVRNGHNYEDYVNNSDVVRDCDGNNWYSEIASDYLTYSEHDEEYHVEDCSCSAMQHVTACDGVDYYGDDKDDLIEDTSDNYHVQGCACAQIACDGEVYYSENLQSDMHGVFHAHNCTCENIRGMHYAHENQLDMLIAFEVADTVWNPPTTYVNNIETVVPCTIVGV